MCTVSWRLLPAGYDVYFNRDEKRVRQPATPPVIDTRDGVRFVAPRDGNSGGTWLAVNAWGVTVGLLNHHPDPAPPEPARRRSRGLLLLDLITADRAAAVVARLGQIALGEHAPFTCVAWGISEPVQAVAWDGRELKPHVRPVAMPLSSSSFHSAEVIAKRMRVFAAMQEGQDDTDDAGWMEAFHRSHVPEKGPFSVCMHRTDARTVSFSRVRVTADAAQFFYHAGSPCGDAVDATVELPLAGMRAS